MKGLRYVFTGEGKGKTSAALGVAMRGLLNDWKVLWISFIKEESWGVSEGKLREKFDNLEMYFVGKGFYIKNSKLKTQNSKPQLKTQKLKTGVVVDRFGEEEHKEAAREGLKLAEEKLVSGEYQLVVLDEVLNALSEGLLEDEAVLRVVGLRGEAHIVLTGRGLGEELGRVADLVTECKKVKHPYDKGIMAVRGLDY